MAYTADYPQNTEAPEQAAVMTPEDWFIAHSMKGGKTTFNRGMSMRTKFRGAAVTGADSGDAYMNARAKFAMMSPAERMDYMQRNGAPQEVMAAMPSESADLPPRLRSMPNAPTPSPTPGFNVNGRFAALVDQQKATNKRAGLAVKMTLANQVLNPEQTVDKAIAVKNAELAKSGITDLGGGTMAMQNKHGTGFVEKLTPEQMATRKPGRIFEGGKEVDVATMMANKGKSTTMPYLNGGQSTAITLDAADANKATIATATNRALTSPETAKRIAADRASQVASYKASTAPLRVAAKQWMAGLTEPPAQTPPAKDYTGDPDLPSVASATARSRMIPAKKKPDPAIAKS